MRAAQEIRISRCAPLALFVYNRPDHTCKTVESLLANIDAVHTPLHVFSDAPRDETASRAVAEVRSYIRSIDRFKSVTIIERETNFGLAQSIIDGVTRLCEEYGRVIVIEDDLITSPHFLSYMNDALHFYQNNEAVASVSAYMYPVRTSPDMNDTELLEFPMSWGWATCLSATTSSLVSQHETFGQSCRAATTMRSGAGATICCNTCSRSRPTSTYPCPACLADNGS